MNKLTREWDGVLDEGGLGWSLKRQLRIVLLNSSSAETTFTSTLHWWVVYVLGKLKNY